GFGLPGAVSLSGSIEDSFERRVDALPAPARTLLLIAAADPSGDAALVRRAAERMGVSQDAALPAADAGLVAFGSRVRFRHPLARSAVYRGASPDRRRAVHRALAETTDQELDPDRCAWHRAQAAPGPDERVAGELERSAGRARARGGLAAASAFLKQSALLTPDLSRRAGRALAAAQTEIQAGALDAARDLLAMTEPGPLTARQQATADVLRARLAFVTARGGDAPVLLLQAARELAPVDVPLARATYLDALSAAVFAGPLAGPGGDVRVAARAARRAPAAHGPVTAPDLLLEGTAAALAAGYAAGVPALRKALGCFGHGMTAEEELRWMWLACVTAIRLWDETGWDRLSLRYLQLARETGALGELPLALTQRAYWLLFTGDLPGGAALIDELHVVKEATGSGLAPYGALALAAMRGDEAGVTALTAATIKDATERGEGIGIVFAEWARALVGNSLGRYENATAAGRRATARDDDLAALCMPLPELVEAATRCGTTDVAVRAHEQLGEMARAVGTDWALGVQARSRALLAQGDAAEAAYREAVARFGKTRLRVDLARSHLVYGEWLRRQRRRNDAREQLRTAHTMLQDMGLNAFAERAGRELRAAGGTFGRRRTPAGDGSLTAQEAQIARMARDGLSNPEIGNRLFISARTVQYHLRKVFTKLGITSRSQLDSVLESGLPTRPS
ncbi:LuxR family transcriptional regulator, partial [Streptomyces sp. SID5785]|uniref:helix-turn-helix domain-containing protein n=1 Tax=Streptomyces sp. SID5785 TaxID=2690309 RepID=UPI001361D4C4